MRTALFLLPHSDDEIFAMTRIVAERARGLAPTCVFLTTGTLPERPDAVRDLESQRNLARWGVPVRALNFLGTRMGIPDGGLPASLERVFQTIIEGSPVPERLYCPAWEGGHHDHDAAHLLGVALGIHFARLDQTFEYSAYNGYRTRGRFFRVLSPVWRDARTEARRVPLRLGVRIALSALAYRTQWKTWLGLLPMVLTHAVLSRWEIINPVSPDRLAAPPHPGALLYERYGRMRYPDFRLLTSRFVETRILEPEGRHGTFPQLLLERAAHRGVS